MAEAEAEQQALTEDVETSSYQKGLGVMDSPSPETSSGDDHLRSLEVLGAKHRHRCSPIRWLVLMATAALILLLAVCFRYFHSRVPAHSDTIQTTSVCEDQDPIMSLKASSVLTGLHHGAVATDHPICSQVGLDILQKEGGNAVDAAVAVTLCLGVANPASSGLGGGAFILIHADETDKVANINFTDARADSPLAASGKITEVIDCREVAPAASTTNMYKDLPTHASERGGLAIPVLGELRGLELAHARHGRLSWGAVVQPAVGLAQKGVVVNANLAHEIGILAKRYTQASNRDFDLGLRALLTHNNDWHSPLLEGDVLRNPKLAETLRAIRDGGADALYAGDRAARLAEDIQNAGGIVTKDDIENYRATLRTPVVGHGVHGFSVVGVPPPSSGGGAIIGAARFLADFKFPFSTFADTLSIHRLVEACKHAFAIRMSLSDPAYDSARVNDAIRDLVETSYMLELSRKTQDNVTLRMSQYGGPKWAQLNDTDGQSAAVDADEGDRRRLARRFGYLEDGGTSHFAIVDQDGNSVSVTTSINTYFGSNVLSPSSGIVFSNSMDDFATPGRPNYYGLHPSKANYIKPGKKPLSSMAPTMVFRRPERGNHDTLGDLMLVLGASGGPKIISAVFQVLTSVVLLGLPLFEAVVKPRVHDQLIYHGAAVTTTENTVLEQGPSISVSKRTRDALTARGHGLLDVTYEGTVQAIAIDLETKELTAACDVRKGGSPAGY